MASESRQATPVAASDETQLGLRNPGSFRDPSGFVFRVGGIVYRQVNSCYREDYDHFVSSGLAAGLFDRALLIRP